MEKRFSLPGWLCAPIGALLLAAAFGMLVWLALPWMVVVMDDDFWYLKSVVETYQRGRPWTSEWLTPWGASTSLLVVSLFKVTDSFSFAVHGALALCGAGMYLGMLSFLKCTGEGVAKRAFIPLLVLGTPTVFFMLLMFTSVALYLACLWWCLYFFVKRQWLGFLLVWCVAISSRQSAIAWLALPGWEFLTMLGNAYQHKRLEKGWWKTPTVIVAGGLMVLTLKFGMNETHGQKAVMDTVKSAFAVNRLLLPLTMGLFTMTTAYGLGCFFSKTGQSSAATNRTLTRALRWAAFILLSAALIITGRWLHPQIVTTHAAYTGSISMIGFHLWAVLGAAGLAFFPVTRPAIGMLLAALGSIVLVSLYSGSFDYYYIDAFFLCFAAAFACNARLNSKSKAVLIPRSSLSCWVLTVVTASVFIFQGGWNLRSYVKMKYAQDRYASLITLAEHNVRNGKLSVVETGFAGFGYNGWKLENHYHEHAEKDEARIAGFLVYTRPYSWNGTQGVGVVGTYPKVLKPYKSWLPTHNPKSLDNNQEAEVLDSFTGSLLWRYEANFLLKKIHVTGGTLDMSSYKNNCYPLNDDEWRQYMKASTCLPK